MARLGPQIIRVANRLKQGKKVAHVIKASLGRRYSEACYFNRQALIFLFLVALRLGNELTQWEIPGITMSDSCLCGYIFLSLLRN